MMRAVALNILCGLVWRLARLLFSWEWRGQGEAGLWWRETGDAPCLKFSQPEGLWVRKTNACYHPLKCWGLFVTQQKLTHKVTRCKWLQTDVCLRKHSAEHGKFMWDSGQSFTEWDCPVSCSIARVSVFCTLNANVPPSVWELVWACGSRLQQTQHRWHCIFFVTLYHPETKCVRFTFIIKKIIIIS